MSVTNIKIPQFTTTVLRNKQSAEAFLANCQYTLMLIQKEVTEDFAEMAHKAHKASTRVLRAAYDAPTPSSRSQTTRTNTVVTLETPPNKRRDHDSPSRNETYKPPKFADHQVNLRTFNDEWHKHDLFEKVHIDPALKAQMLSEYEVLETIRTMRDAMMVASDAAMSLNSPLAATFVTQINDLIKQVADMGLKVTSLLGKMAEKHRPKLVRKVLEGTRPKDPNCDDGILHMVAACVVKCAGISGITSYMTADSDPVSHTHGKLMHVDYFHLKNVSFVSDEEKVHQTVFCSLIFVEGVFYLKFSPRRFVPKLGHGAGLAFVASASLNSRQQVVARSLEIAGFAGSSLMRAAMAANFNDYASPEDVALFTKVGARFKDVVRKIDIDKKEGKYIAFTVDTSHVSSHDVLSEIHRLCSELTSKYQAGVQWSVSQNAKAGSNEATIVCALNNPPIRVINMNDIRKLRALGLEEDQMMVIVQSLNNMGATRNPLGTDGLLLNRNILKDSNIYTTPQDISPDKAPSWGGNNDTHSDFERSLEFTSVADALDYCASALKNYEALGNLPPIFGDNDHKAVLKLVEDQYMARPSAYNTEDQVADLLQAALESYSAP